jgi:putative drug exporter of the RND superfamily
MTRLTNLALTRPLLVLGAWFSLIGVLGLIGFGVGNRLHRANLTVPGSPSAHAAELRQQRFGESYELLVALKGPAAAIEQRGPIVARRIDALKDVSLVDPWRKGFERELRPAPDQALLLVGVKGTYDEASSRITPRVREVMDEAAGPRLKAHLAGFPDIGNAIHEDTLKAVEKAELIAAPLLLLILLLVLRSPIAAAVPLTVGGTIVGGSTGLLDLINRLTPLDAAALNLASMMGLALGVDYSLLMVARFREELEVDGNTKLAAGIASRTAGRTVRFAGIVLLAAMVTAAFIAPGNLLLSVTIGVLVAVALSLLASATVLPAALVFLGPRVNKWRIGRKGSGSSAGWGSLAFRAVSRPGIAALLVLVLLCVMAAPSLGLQTGPPDPLELPASDRTRQDFEAVKNPRIGGFVAPYELVVAAPHGTITSPQTLKKLARFQDDLAAKPWVRAVLGPGAIYRRTGELRRVPATLERSSSQLDSGNRALDRLKNGLGRVGGGVDQLQGGLAEAASGAFRIQSGTGDAQTGARQLQSGMEQARSGAARLVDGLGQAKSGILALTSGSGKARAGAAKLLAGIKQIRSKVSGGLPGIHALADGLETGGKQLGKLREPAQIADKSLSQALGDLNAMLPTSKADPHYIALYEHVARAKGAVSGKNPVTGQPVADGYHGLDADLKSASAAAGQAADGARQIEKQTGTLLDGLDRLERGASDLQDGLVQLDDGAHRLQDGADSLISGGSSLSTGIARLQVGTGALADGIARLHGGVGLLGQRLHEGVPQTGQLGDGVGRITNGVGSYQDKLRRLKGQTGDVDRLGTILNSGYGTLAALDTAKRKERETAAFGLNLDRGGNAGVILVAQAGGNPGAPGDPGLGRVEAAADRLARETGLEVRVGGGNPLRHDFDEAASGRFPLLVLALVAVTFLVLIPILRSILLPAIAVLLNVLTVAAAFGVLALLFQGDSPPLGGAGYIDDIMLNMIFSTVFALSIDYEVFLMARMREGWLKLGETDGAIAYGLRHTASVITGAALIMTGVFAAFATSEVTSMRQIGVGLTVAVLLDATLVRLVLLPALMRLAGDRVWWLPGWLDRLIPVIDVDGPVEPAPPRPEPAAAVA